MELLINPVHLLRVLHVTMHLLADWHMVLKVRPELVIDVEHLNLHQLMWWHIRLRYSVRQRHRLQPFHVRRRSFLYLHWQVEFARLRPRLITRAIHALWASVESAVRARHVPG